MERVGKPWYCKYLEFSGDLKLCGRSSCTVILFTSNRCNLKCKGKKYGCRSGCHKPNINKNNVLDIEAAIKWMEKFTPGCDVHITGGEPFVLPGMVDSINRVINAGHRVSVFTNATLLRKYQDTGVYDLPVTWQITHHYPQVDYAEFMHQIEPLPPERVLLCRILGKDEQPDAEVQALYNGYRFEWLRNRYGFVNHTLKREWPRQPNDGMLLIGPNPINGSVFSCSAPNRVYGNIHNMDFDAKAASEYTCGGGYPDYCQACHSIEILKELHEGVKT